MNTNSAMQKIAMIDDHNLLRSGLANIINEFNGFEVTLQAVNGRDFIEKMQTHEPPDIVLLDINMTVMNGYETAAWIRENLPQVKILVLSMLDTDYAFIRMLKLGARGFMIKDSHPDQFYRALVEIRDNGIYMNEILSPKMAHRLNKDYSQTIDAAPNLIPRLSDKEIEFLKLVCSEMTYREIAMEMGISHRTADGYRDTLFNKLGVCTRVGLVLYSIKNGIVMV
ncbi:response regulator [Flavihumibacter stibioxidans]|nr:response regulator transcription factor [Flavihumibacter stibioxidans]